MKIEHLKPFGLQLTFNSTEQLSVNDLNYAKSKMSEHKLVILRGLKSLSKDEFLKFALFFSRDGDSLEDRLLHWSFGPVMELKVDRSTENYLFSSEKVPFHWDGAFHREPTYLAFNCIDAPEQSSGGETLFCNMEGVLESMTTTQKKKLQKMILTYKTEKKAHYGGEITVPPLFRHPITGKEVLRYAEPVETKLNPVSLDIAGVDKDTAQSFQYVMADKIYSEDFCYKHQWQNGDLLLVDNFATIHGRKSFSKQTNRHIRRIQVL